MGVYRGFVLVLWSAAMLTLPAQAASQTRGTGLPIAIGQKVSITTADGTVTKGTIQTLTPASVVLANSKGVVSLAAADVTRIRVPDSPWDGAVKSALMSGLLGLAAGALASSASFEKPDQTDYLLKGAGAGLAIGAVLGGVIDAIRMETVYERHAGMSVSVRPIVSAAGKGVGVRLQW